MSDIDHVQAAAYAACCKVSPSNPLAVAEAIVEAFKFLTTLEQAAALPDHLRVPTLECLAVNVRALIARMEKRQ